MIWLKGALVVWLYVQNSMNRGSLLRGMQTHIRSNGIGMKSEQKIYPSGTTHKMGVDKMASSKVGLVVRYKQLLWWTCWQT